MLYSNDGRSETVAVAVDDRFLGTFGTRAGSDWGRLWDVFLPSPALPRPAALPPGWHTLRVGALLPSDGVELDSVRLALDDEGLTRAVLDCLLLCRAAPPSLPPNTGARLWQRAVLDCLLLCRAAPPSLPPNTGARLWQRAGATQASYPTKCAEEDNVKVY